MLLLLHYRLNMKIDFEFESEFGIFRDALHLPDDHTFSEQEIAQMKQKRFDDWLEICKPKPEELTAEINLLTSE